MKKVLIEKLDSFNAAPFTIQRISELLADPRKQYSRIDKFMRAVEKNILVVSTVAPGRHRSEESENGDSLDSALNGEFSSDVNVDIDMDKDGSFTMTKEFNVTTHRKEENHDVVTTNHDVITIKKTASTEEEAGTSAIAIDAKTGEPPQGTQTDISIESQSTVTITVCEPETKPDDLPIVTGSEENPKSTSETNEENAQEQETKSEATQESVITEIIEPKIDDALLNEPLRPNDEILVDTSDISATTPLAALENIVAIRTDPSIIEAVETPLLESTPSQVSSEEDTTDNSEQENSKSSSDDCESESGIEAKRLKIEEFEEKADEQAPAEEILEETELKPAEVEEKPTQEVPQKEEEEKGESAQPEPIAISTITEEITQTIPPVETAAAPIVEEEAIISEAIEEEPQIDNAETMETTVPIVENTMALDEDEPSVPAAVAEMEMAPVAANKMDTDENEETALMDVDDEPMDQ